MKLHDFLRRLIIVPLVAVSTPLLYLIGYLLAGHAEACGVVRDAWYLAWRGVPK